LERWETEEHEPANAAPEQLAGPAPVLPSAPEPARWEPAAESEPAEPVAAFVRPYVLTGGRTQAGSHFRLETLVSARRPGVERVSPANHAHRAVVKLCARPKSVAEVAALMMVPLGVARVLVNDLAQAGALFVHRASANDGEPDAVLLSRVLSGLRRL